jgi:glycosyltransferase involved in cell wall biosynthesis
MISDVYFPRVNGVSTSIRTFRNDLHALGMETALIAPEYPEPGDGEGVIRIPSRYLFFDPEDRLMHRRPIHALTPQLRGRFDVVHIHTPFVAHGAGLKLARSLGLPVVESYHTFFEEYFHHYLPILPRPMLRQVAGAISRHQCNQVDAVIVPTPMIRDVLEAYGVTRPVHVLPTGLNLGSLQDGDGSRFRKAAGIAPDRPVLLHVGRVAGEKNIGFLLQVVARVRHAVPDLLFVIAGEGPAQKNLQAQVYRDGLQGAVQFVGNLDRETELLDCYAAADIFIFASRTETQGLVLLEAMAIGVPLVSTAVLGTKAVLEKARGACVVPEEIETFAGRVIELLQSPDLRRELSAQVRRSAAEWSGEKMARRLVEIYRGLSAAEHTACTTSA